MSFFIADKFIEALKDAGLFSEDEYNSTRRVILDFEVGHAGVMYVERHVDDRILDVVLQGGLKLVTEPEQVTG